MRAVRDITNSDYRAPTASLFSKLEILDIFQVNTRDITKFMLRLTCSRLRDSRARGIEKAQTRKRTGGNFSRPAPIFARPTLSRLPHSFARAWTRLLVPGPEVFI